MKKLNELVEQAKFVADWHGSDWSSALCQDKDGKQAHEIICESRGEAVISTGSNSNEASWLCDYLELCSPENILAIAEAFRALEKRAEAAEAERSALQDGFAEAIRHKDRLADELNELAKQEPVAWISSGEHAILSRLKKHAAVEVGLFNVQRFSDDTPIFTSAPIPTGWKVVPIEPTERMVIAGFESELDEDFSETEVWEEFQMMSGCQQAAYKARLCWSAMIDAAPTPPE